ncbi:hypothetical protein EDD58_101308 [Hazenella coriacea]|uniref:DUF5658 domain-containing protein n=1 Tax=Hazenella coriacea TaxID=1179467 RepID=A0A4R3LAE4_9BACL|nr:hypothetical protein EDD58_101308 [Hazenella coriacea]
MLSEGIEEQSFSFLLSQLAFSPLFILKVIACAGFLYIFRNDKGCLTIIGRVYSIIFLLIYLISLYWYWRYTGI